MTQEATDAVEDLRDIGLQATFAAELGRESDKTVLKLVWPPLGELDQTRRIKAGPIEEKAELPKVDVSRDFRSEFTLRMPPSDLGNLEQMSVVEPSARLSNGLRSPHPTTARTA
jgi:hypothetical protein